MSADIRMMFFASLTAILPLDSVVPGPSVVLVVGEGEEDAGEGDALPPARDMSTAEREAEEKAARAYLEAREARIKAEAKLLEPKED